MKGQEAYIGDMAEKWDQIAHVLQREDREFREAMKGQVVLPLLVQIVQRNGILKEMHTGPCIITPCTTEKGEKNTKFLDYACLQAALISIGTHSLFCPFST